MSGLYALQDIKHCTKTTPILTQCRLQSKLRQIKNVFIVFILGNIKELQCNMFCTSIVYTPAWSSSSWNGFLVEAAVVEPVTTGLEFMYEDGGKVTGALSEPWWWRLAGGLDGKIK